MNSNNELDKGEEDVKEDSKFEENSEQTDIKNESSKKTKTVKSAKKEIPLLMLVADTKYKVIKFVGKNVFNFKLTTNPEDNWDLCWQDLGVGVEVLAKMKSYQKINHFPGMYELSRKNNLAKNLMKMRKCFPKEFNFFPSTWLLPSEFPELLATSKKRHHITYIAKPEASSQGRGIFLAKKIEDINPEEHLVVQKYIENPLLIDGLKFDLRIYVLLYGCNPIRLFIHKEGLARFCTEKYQRPNAHNLQNNYTHLTNYAINKTSDKFIFNTDYADSSKGHKRNLQCIFKYIDENGGDSNKVLTKIEDAIIK